MTETSSKHIRYELIYKSKDSEPTPPPLEYEIEVDALTLEHPAPAGSQPDWTLLTTEQCPHCPLSADKTEHCPLAVRLAPLLERCNPPGAHDRVDIRVIKDGLTICTERTTQEGYRSLIGLVMATSGCPHTAFFKPMAWFHMPFSSNDETLFRACATFLLFQFFDPPDADHAGRFADLKAVYENIHQVNLSIAKRLRNASAAESTLNALTVLDIFAQSIQPTLTQSLEELEFLFRPGLDEISFEAS